MERRKKNNIIIGTLCAVLVLMGVGYAILSTTLNIGATANITGDFDIHFTNIERSSSTISDTTILSTIDAGTGITANTSSRAGTFTAILQKPTDYVIYTVSVANTGSIDGYLTFSFEDTNSNFNYYKDFYSVEFIRDDVNPVLSTDILQPNASFTDTEVLENTTGTRTYKIKVTFKESATSFPDPTTNGAFECTLNVTYSQQAPGGNSGGNTESNINWYVANSDGTTEVYGVEYDNVNDKYDLIYYISDGIDRSSYIPSGAAFVLYDSSITIDVNNSGVTPQNGDYVYISVEDNETTLFSVLRNNTIYTDSHGNVTSYTLDPTGSLEKYLASGDEEEDNFTWYAAEYENDSLEIALDEDNIMKHIIANDVDLITIYESSVGQVQFNAYDPNIVLAEQSNGTLVGITPQSGDYVWVIQIQEGGNNYNFVAGLLRGDTLYTLNFDDYSVFVTTRQD